MEKKLLTYAGAGHPPLLFFRKSAGNASEVVENGLFLGMFPEATYASLQTPISAGDRCVIYTDGVPEAKSPAQEEFGTARFKRFMESNQALAADQLAEGLLDELCRWTQQLRGEGQTDDITVLVVDFKSF
jgi:serine phosphatase RsbU (regulator of sigma subunit)